MVQSFKAQSGRPQPSPANPETRFSRTAWLVLGLALSLLLLSIGQKAYRLTLPTDGWRFITGEIGSVDQDRPIYTTNLLGLPSPLQPGDRLLAVEGRSFETIYAEANARRVQPLPNWQAGRTVQVTVERDGRSVTVAVPLYRWQIGTVLHHLFDNLTLPAAMLLAAVGWFVFLKRSRDWAAQALLLFSLCLLVANISSALVEWSLPEMLTPGIFWLAIFCSNWIFATVMFPSLLLLTLVFPRPKAFVQTYPRLVVAVLYAAVPLLIVALGPIAVVGWVSVLGMTLLSLIALAHSFFTGRDPISRAQMRWALGGLVAMVLGFIPMNLSGLGWWPLPFPPQLEAIWFPLMLVVVALGFGVAILRYRLFDIDVILNRALVYGLLTAGVIGVYVFVVGYLSALFRVEEHLLISLVATGVVAVLFQPARGWLQRGINRLMYGQRDEPVAVLTQLGRQLEVTMTPQEILPVLAQTVAQVLKLPYVAITLSGDDPLKAQTEIGQLGPNLETFPLSYQGQTAGQLVVAPRAPGEPFNAADRLLLENIARQAGVVAHAVNLTTALQQSRRQIITAREEERRRLRRDLHDGLGPQLASQTLTIDAIDKLLERDPATARELLRQLKQQSQTAITDIRRLVYDLRPPALDDLGLVEALREGAVQYQQAGLQLTIDASPQPLPFLPAAVEVAAYRIGQEAITNVVRHSRATCCTVRLTAHRSDLQVTVSDNGRGFPAQVGHGVGLKSMQERTHELGGRLIIENLPEGGAQICVWLPLPEEDA